MHACSMVMESIHIIYFNMSSSNSSNASVIISTAYQSRGNSLWPEAGMASCCAQLQSVYWLWPLDMNEHYGSESGFMPASKRDVWTRKKLWSVRNLSSRKLWIDKRLIGHTCAKIWAEDKYVSSSQVRATSITWVSVLLKLNSTGQFNKMLIAYSMSKKTVDFRLM